MHSSTSLSRLLLVILSFAASDIVAAEDYLRVEGEAASREIDTSKAIDVINIASDGKPDLRIIGWLNGGSVRLNAGKATMTFRMHSGNNHHGGIDCFVLTKIPFTPKSQAVTGFLSNAGAVKLGDLTIDSPMG